ncbi:MAG: DUF4190 domain-containing protein [Pirellulales bacterium]|nr:DUF4190 domain-containing protein [Pirellulales bacterium]
MNSQPPQPQDLPPVEVVPQHPHAGGHIPPGRRDIGDDAGMRMLLPVGRSAYAIFAGYMGLFSVLGIFAPLAILFGALAVREIKASEGTAHPKHGMGRAIFGIVMGVLGTMGLIVGIIAFASNSGPRF